MTVALANPNPVNMPGYNNPDLDEVHSLPRYQVENRTLTQYSDYSYIQTSMVSHTPGMFSFSQTEPSSDLLSGSWGMNGEGAQNFQDFPDSGSSHSGEGEEYVITPSGHTTPRGSRLDRTQATDNTWNTTGLSAMSTQGQNMSRVNSARSQLSNLDVRGNASAFRNGSQATSTMVGAGPCLLEPEVSPVYWQSYGLDAGLHAEQFPSLVAPSQMQFGPDASIPDNSSTGSWDCFSSSISRTSSPATVEDGWIVAQLPLSPQSSPEMPCQSPNIDIKLCATKDEFAAMPLADAMTLPTPFLARRPTNDGESARDHELYKSAMPAKDGLFHCPWEGDDSCNHKPEKLKCNYDKFVDSHLKPYRCKADACEGARFSSTACLLRHEREAHGLHGHGDRPFRCPYDSCERNIPGNGFPRQWNLKDHMKRVHNDVGSASGSPPSTVAQVSKPQGRKRKSDNTDAPSRKASQKVMPAKEPKQPAAKPLIQQWMDHRSAVEQMLRLLEKPEDVASMHQITEIQKHLNAMSKMTTPASYGIPSQPRIMPTGTYTG